jgi:hypothetical protein
VVCDAGAAAEVTWSRHRRDIDSGYDTASIIFNVD